MTEPVYHFTNTLCLPWIIETGELRPSPAFGGWPDNFVWAKANPGGNHVSDAMGAISKLYHAGGAQLIRFTLPGDAFIPLCELMKEWTPASIENLEKIILESGFEADHHHDWCCRSDPLPVTQVLAVDAKSYGSCLWEPIEATPEFCIKLPDDDPEEGGQRRGFVIGNKTYWATRYDVPGGQNYRGIFTITTFS